MASRTAGIPRDFICRSFMLSRNDESNETLRASTVCGELSHRWRSTSAVHMPRSRPSRTQQSKQCRNMMSVSGVCARPRVYCKVLGRTGTDNHQR